MQTGLGLAILGANVIDDIVTNVNAGKSDEYIARNAIYDITTGVGTIVIAAKAGAAVGSVLGGPVGTAIGIGIGLLLGWLFDLIQEACN